ncbi:uncharacterized protein [Temnothorax nylanderi]|uniref:uncharacterized protein n=1 Tax=Temnothorax nylanderi TaxID=102681 RepID=UPI003A84F593
MMSRKVALTVDREVIEAIIDERLKDLKREIKELKKERDAMDRRMNRMEQDQGKRKRDESEERGDNTYKRKWCFKDNEESEEEKRKKNIIIRVEKVIWGEGGTNLSKVQKLISKRLKMEVELKEVSVLGQRGEWLTMLLKLGNEDDKWKVLDARRREGSRMRVKMDEDKSLEDRIKERKEREKRKEWKEKQNRKSSRSAEDEISKKMEENLLMISDEEEEGSEGRSWKW